MHINKSGHSSGMAISIIEQITVKSDFIKELFFTMDYSIILLKSGKLAFEIPEKETVFLNAEEMAFLPMGLFSTVRTVEESELIVFRLSRVDNWKKYCQICEKKASRSDDEEEQNTDIIGRQFKKIRKEPRILPVSKHLSAYLEELLNHILIFGKESHAFAELKAKEFLLLVQHYYTPEEADAFFADIVGKETSFAEYVQANWSKYSSINELALAMGLSVRQFNARFNRMFEEITPYQWIIGNRARLIQYELVRTDKPFKQISMENKFKTLPHFNTFCKKHLGKTPSEIRGVLRKKKQVAKKQSCQECEHAS